MPTLNAGANDHPMDQFPVRPLRFDLDDSRAVDVVWSRTCPEFAVFLNALGMHVPHFERYLVRTLRQVREKILDPALQRDVTAIIGQEANHAHNFIKVNDALIARYPDIGEVDAQSQRWFIEHSKSDSLKRQVAFTAGYETFTFLAGMIILDNHELWFADADPVMKAIWVWHQVEEVEHGAVAFEVYKALYGEHEWYRKRMVLSAALHIARDTVVTYIRMAREEGWLRNPFTALSRLGFGAAMLTRLFVAALPVFRRGYHPRLHPLATTAQNPIQIAWRRYAAQGGDVLSIDHDKMAAIMRVEPA
jgi:predicted metal-dependent hydrolase